MFSKWNNKGVKNLSKEESMKIRWKYELCPSCKTYIVYTDGRALCNTCKLSIDNTSEEDQLELPLDFEDKKDD